MQTSTPPGFCLAFTNKQIMKIDEDTLDLAEVGWLFKQILGNKQLLLRSKGRPVVQPPPPLSAQATITKLIVSNKETKDKSKAVQTKLDTTNELLTKMLAFMEKGKAYSATTDAAHAAQVSVQTHEPPKGPTMTSNIPAPQKVTFVTNSRKDKQQNELDDITPILNLDDTGTPQGTDNVNQTKGSEEDWDDPSGYKTTPGASEREDGELSGDENDQTLSNEQRAQDKKKLVSSTPNNQIGPRVPLKEQTSALNTTSKGFGNTDDKEDHCYYCGDGKHDRNSCHYGQNVCLRCKRRGHRRSECREEPGYKPPPSKRRLGQGFEQGPPKRPKVDTRPFGFKQDKQDESGHRGNRDRSLKPKQDSQEQEQTERYDPVWEEKRYHEDYTDKFNHFAASNEVCSEEEYYYETIDGLTYATDKGGNAFYWDLELKDWRYSHGAW